MKCLHANYFHNARPSNRWGSILLDISLHMVIICDSPAITWCWVLMQSLDLSLGFYAALVKPVAQDLALILCQLFPLPPCKLPLLLEILQSTGGVEALKSQWFSVFPAFSYTLDKAEQVNGGDTQDSHKDFLLSITSELQASCLFFNPLPFLFFFDWYEIFPFSAASPLSLRLLCQLAAINRATYSL